MPWQWLRPAAGAQMNPRGPSCRSKSWLRCA